ncbi:phosphoglycolate phosphatase 2-like [Helicoverpa zea]|uniref:phosphoglycolate phosphatase 2-like n=1 Tax=Helicoverpa zea TaxID=7113 RepID=UPI001F55BAFF|nr:phosphoglycolate phosphatase 2-like [Helicoverpa zea]
MESIPVNLQELSPEGFKKFLDSFDHVFSDCDGVIWSKDPFPDAGKFFTLMKKHGKTVHFVSNNSLRSKENYDARFKAAEIENGYDYLTIPSIAIAEYLKSVNFNKKVFSSSCSQTNFVLNSYGFEIKEGPDVVPDYYEEFASYLKDDPEIGAVVMDCDFKVNLPKVNKAITYLKRPDCLFLCGATDRHVYFKGGYKLLATGVFSEMVHEETGREPVMLGKPGKAFGQFAMKRAGVTDPSRVLFIGDMIDQDIALGKTMGFKTLLVLTNIPKEGMLAHKTIKPDFYADQLGSIVPLLNK